VTVTVVAAVLPTSKALVVEVALEAEYVLPRVTVTAGAGGQSKGVAATSAVIGSFHSDPNSSESDLSWRNLDFRSLM